jgi:hypothetical protein
MNHQKSKIRQFSIWALRIGLGLFILAILLVIYNIIAVQHNINVQTEWRQCFKDFSGDEETNCVDTVNALRLPTVQQLFTTNTPSTPESSVNVDLLRKLYEERNRK